MPNSQIWSNPVINYSSGGTQRVEVKVDIAQRKDVACAIEALKKMIASDPRVLGGTTLAPVVTAADYQREGGAAVRVAVWVSGADAQLAADDMRERARTVLEEAGCKTADAARGQRAQTMRARQSETPFA
nr:mechanosensitive ion channel family protein [Paraburkholderia caribensis]